MSVVGHLIAKGIYGDDAFGKKPKVPELPVIEPDKVQAQTVSGNLGVMQQAAQLGEQVNLFSQQQLMKLQEMALPGGLAQGQENILAMLRGELPPDVAAAVTRASAGRAIAGGFAGSGAARSLGLRDLGLQSLQTMQAGLGAMERWLASTVAERFNVTSMFFTPQQRLGFEMDDRAQRFQRDLLAAQVKAAPDPFAASMAAEIDRLHNTLAQDAHRIGVAWSMMGTPQGVGAGGSPGGGGGTDLAALGKQGGAGGGNNLFLNRQAVQAEMNWFNSTGGWGAGSAGGNAFPGQ